MLSAGVICWFFSTTSRFLSEANYSIYSKINRGNQFPIVNSPSIRPSSIPEKIKGVYLTARSAGSKQKLNETIELIENTQLNAVVIDTKNARGKVLYDSNIDLVDKLDLEDNRLGDVPAMIEKLHQKDIYVIARQTVFKDSVLAEKRPDFALKNKQGGIWRNKNGLAWVDPSKRRVWNYNVKLAKEAIKLGFDEVNFDYVRFPTDGDLSNIKFENKSKNQPKHKIMEEFFAYLEQNLSDEPAAISVDFFGIVMERDSGGIIGQRMQDVVDKVDFVSPMMYPSHYPKGHIGLANPGKYPKKVLENGLEQGEDYFENSQAKLRPWIQAFSLNYNYDKHKLNQQINMVDKFTDAGWLLWDARNTYDHFFTK